MAISIGFTIPEYSGAAGRADEPKLLVFQRTLEAVLDASVGAGIIPYSEAPYSVGNPSDTETVTIGSNVYEFCTAAGSVASDSRIAVLIGANARATATNLCAAINAEDANNAHPTLFKTDGTTPALANGTENVLAVHVQGGDVNTGTIYLYKADEPGGAKVQGAGANLALSDTATNLGPFKHLNMNLGVGAGYAMATKQVHGKHAVAAANLTATQPLLIPLPFAPQSWNVQVRSADGALKPNAYAAVTVPAAVGVQNFLGIDIKPTSPTVLQRAVFTTGIKNNDTAISTWAIGRSIDVRAISWACGEDPAAALTVTIARITAADASGSTDLTTAEDIAGGTQNGQVTALTLDEAGGDIPIAVSATQALLFSVIAANGVVDPVTVTFFIDYVELCIATDVIHFDVYGA